MLKTTNTNASTQSCGSQTTLVPAGANHYCDLDIVIFGTAGSSPEFTAAVMVGLTPAIEGDKGVTPEGALRKLLVSTCELLKTYIPKVGAHQRNIHGGGVYDEVSFRSRFATEQIPNPPFLFQQCIIVI